MQNAGYWFSSMALAAGDFGPHPMKIPLLPGMTPDAGAATVKSETQMSIGNIFSEADTLRRWGQGDQFRSRYLTFHKRQMGAWSEFVLFIISGFPLPILITIDV